MSFTRNSIHTAKSNAVIDYTFTIEPLMYLLMSDKEVQIL